MPGTRRSIGWHCGELVGLVVRNFNFVWECHNPRHLCLIQHLNQQGKMAVCSNCGSDAMNVAFETVGWTVVSDSYEKKYREAFESKLAEQIKDNGVQEEPTKVETTSEAEVKEANQQRKTSTSSSTKQDLDTFLLGDPGDSDDDGPDNNGGGDFDDDFDKMLEGLDDDKDDL